ncbi:MAG TPA: UDP-N-acetylmuramoyl-L-alanine--D-glutamate ligase [Symbiobacteriaceae bacterium]|nr:UDP-N-acetylmuramoyl-L-alanine--D-glutamate ligase [Symbiobacteriaceae bacterium]
MDFTGKHVVVVGIGVSNMPLIRYLLGKGAQVTACDRKNETDLGERAVELKALGVDLSTGAGYLAPLAQHDVIFLTPGIPKHLPEIKAAKERGAAIYGEIGLVLANVKAPVIGITGSAGKTTTTTLIGAIMEAAGRETYVGGNIGKPLIEKAETIPEHAAVVLELSSFQLQLVGERSPNISIITNITPNHLDVHADMDEYITAKQNIYRYQKPGDTVILNYDDELVRGFADGAPARAVWFSRKTDPGQSTCAFVRDGEMIWRYNGQEYPTLRLDELKLLGLHQQENVLAAMAACYLAGAGMNAIRSVLTTFTGVEHRQEPVRELDGAKWYNDSKATSPAETVACLTTLAAPIVLIAGGSDKGIPFDPMAPLVAEKVKVLILTGPTGPKIEEAAVRAGYTRVIHRAKDMAEAVQLARQAAAPGDNVVLSPACASFDAFKNFEHRGQVFKELVNALA